MPPIRLSKKALAWTISGVFATTAAILAGVLVLTGGLDDGDQMGSRTGFVAGAAPRGDRLAADWPEYGYDQERTRANAALHLGPPFRRVWTHDAGSLLEFPPVIAGGRVFVGTNHRRALALRASTGTAVWNRRLSGRVAASPAIAGDLILFSTIDGFVTALHRSNGSVAWRRDVGSATESSPLVVDGLAYVGTAGGLILCMNARTGALRWSARATGAVKSSLARSGAQVVVGDYSGRISALSRLTGRIRWRTTSPGRFLAGAGTFYANPAVAYGRIYAANVNGRVIALSARTGQVAWVRVLGDWVYSSPAISRRTVYVGSYDHNLYALNAVTGGVRWKFDAGMRITGSPTVIGDLVWFSTLARKASEGRTFALNARSGSVVFTFRDGRYTPAVGVRGLLVLTGVHTLYGLAPTR